MERRSRCPSTSATLVSENTYGDDEEDEEDVEDEGDEVLQNFLLRIFSHTTIFIFLREWIIIHILHNVILFGFSNETTGFNYFMSPNLQIWRMNKSRHYTVHMCIKPSS